MGALGQELSGVSDILRRKIEGCFTSIADRLVVCFEEAHSRGEISDRYSPRQLAELMADCWEGAALRSRLKKNPDSLNAMVDFFLKSVSQLHP
jgi:TetR/AcrR family transcriptional repressor of nem operon